MPERNAKIISKKSKAVRDNWEKSGLLEGILAKHKTYLSVEFNHTAIHLIKHASEYGDETATMIFPVIRRVFVRSNYKKINVVHIIEVFDDCNRLCFELIKTLANRSYNRIDAEAEFCLFFCEYYCTEFLSMKRRVIIEKNNNLIHSLRSFSRSYGWDFFQ